MPKDTDKANDAYAEALRRIEVCRNEGRNSLDLSGLGLTVVPSRNPFDAKILRYFVTTGWSRTRGTGWDIIFFVVLQRSETKFRGDDPRRTACLPDFAYPKGMPRTGNRQKAMSILKTGPDTFVFPDPGRLGSGRTGQVGPWQLAEGGAKHGGYDAPAPRWLPCVSWRACEFSVRPLHSIILP